MSSLAEPHISDAEWRVMHEIWLAEPVTSSQIHARLQEKTEWTAGTIKTLLHRLVQKGILEFQRKGNRYLYRSCFTEAQCVEQVSDQLLHTVFQGQPMPMLEYLVHTARLSGTEIQNLRAMLAEIQQELPALPDDPETTTLKRAN
jgi:predicted transcriptional regulator